MPSLFVENTLNQAMDAFSFEIVRVFKKESINFRVKLRGEVQMDFVHAPVKLALIL